MHYYNAKRKCEKVIEGNEINFTSKPKFCRFVQAIISQANR